MPGKGESRAGKSSKESFAVGQRRGSEGQKWDRGNGRRTLDDRLARNGWGKVERAPRKACTSQVGGWASVAILRVVNMDKGPQWVRVELPGALV